MNRVSSHLIVVAFVAVLSSVTAGAVEAAGTDTVGALAALSSANGQNFGRVHGRGFTSTTQNVALAANGAVAAASSTGFGDTEFSSADKLIDDTRSGVDSYWTDDTTDEFPDVVQINFSGNKTIDRVVVYSVQEELNHFGGIDPSDTDTCYVYVLVDFTVEGWNGNNWVNLATVTDNDLCKRTVTFAPFTTDQIRINVTVTGGWSWTRIAEVEAWEAR